MVGIHTTGESASKPTVLECMVNNFEKGFSGYYGVKLSSGKPHSLYPRVALLGGQMALRRDLRYANGSSSICYNKDTQTNFYTSING